MNSTHRFALVLVLASASAIASANLLSDGGFESSGSDTISPLNPLYWRSDLPYGIDNPGKYDVMNGAPPNSVNNTWRSDLLAQEGTHYLLVDGPFEAGKTVLESTEQISVTAGTTYSLSGYFTSVDNKNLANLVFKVEFLDGLGIVVNQAQGQFPAPSWTQGWQTFSISDVAGAGATHARISVSDLTLTMTGNDFALDAFNFDAQPVPEPASLTVLGLGALSLARRRRRGRTQRR